MKINRRQTLSLGLGAALAASSVGPLAAKDPDRDLTAKLRAAAARPALRTGRLKDSVTIETIEVLRRDGQYFVRVRDADGAEGLTLANPSRFADAYPILVNRIAPFMIGKDARGWEDLLADVWRHESNYKWQGLAYWICIARLELAILDLLGKRAGLPVHALLGDKVCAKIGLYYANGDRKQSAEWVLDELEERVAESGAKAVKFKLGARMRTTAASDARDREIIPMARRRFGDDMVLYADANGSYDVPQALETGRMLEAHDYGFFEEPLPFDHLEETRRVADALDVPVAGGEQERSLWRFEWQIANGALQVVQPDLIYFGGLVRSLKVARMAEAAGLQCVPHISSRGLGSLYVAHFASIIPNTTDYQEYKGDRDSVPYEMTEGGGRFVAVDGALPVPDAPGLGVVFDPDYLAGAKPAPT